MKKPNQRLRIALWALLITSLTPYALLSRDTHETINPTDPLTTDPTQQGAQTYTINFNNVSIIEYIRFVSKIMNMNFIFDETELQFNVTIVSEEPISPKNIIAALIQVLRIHNFTLLEQDKNFIITKSTTVTQIPTLVSGDLPETRINGSPIITRVFRLKNINPNSIVPLIKPMTSQTALVEISPETRQLIITDITNNVEKISALLVSLDAPHSPLEIEAYTAKNIAPNELVALATQILAPFAEGNPLTFVPQTGSNTVFVVSTPFLNDKALHVLQDLDSPPQGQISPRGAHVFIYKTLYLSAEQLRESLIQVADDLKNTPAPPLNLIQALDKVNVLAESNSLLFYVDTETLGKLKDILATIDTPKQGGTGAKSAFFIYKPSYRSPEEIEQSLRDIGKDLEASGLIDRQLLETLDTVRYTPSTNSLLFTGGSETIAKVKDLLARIDVPLSEDIRIQHIGKTTFLIYKLQNATAQQMTASLKAFAADFEKGGNYDKAFVDVINSMRYVKETNSLLFTGPEAILERIEILLEKFDLGGAFKEGATYVIYNPVSQSGDELVAMLKDFEQNLISTGVVDKGLFETINNLKWIEKTSSLLISGDPVSIAKVQDLLRKFDVPSKAGAVSSIETIEATSFLIYKLQYHKGEEIKDALKSIASELAKSPAATSQDLVNAVNSLQWIQITNSLIGTGQQDTLAKLKELIESLDVPLRQVFIEVLVVQTTLTNTQNFGLQWGGRAQYFNKVAASTGNFPVPSPSQTVPGVVTPALGISPINATVTPNPTQIPFFSGFDLGVIGDIIMHKGRSFISLGSLVNALQTDADSTIVMNPKIITQDNNNSTIFVGNNIPFVGSQIITTGGGASQATSTNIEYRDIGVNLSITPVIGNGDVVTLDILHDISEVVNNSVAVSGTVTGIQTSHTSMNTRVHVPNKHFLALSGMIQDSKTHFKTQVPCLGGIPVLGLAFQENDRVNSKANVIIFVRPHIIDSVEEYQQLTEDQENLYKDQAVLPILKEQFDAGIDMVKTPEN